MAHQLYVLQVLTFNLLEERMMTKMDPNDQVGARGPSWCKLCCLSMAVAIPPTACCECCVKCSLGPVKTSVGCISSGGASSVLASSCWSLPRVWLGRACPAALGSGLTCLLHYPSQAQRDIIFELRRIAFDAESDPSNAPGSGTEKRKAMYTKDYKMLGFTVSTKVPSPPWQLPLHSDSPGVADRKR